MQESICAMCGKKFIWDYGNMYKVKFAKRTYRFCGYNCYDKAVDVKDNNNSLLYHRLQQTTK